LADNNKNETIEERGVNEESVGLGRGADAEDENAYL